MANLISGVSNSDLGGAIGGIASGIGSLFGGFGQADVFQQQASAYETAAQYAQINEYLSAESGGLQQLATARQVQHVAGTQAADAAANGLKISGSALNLMKDTTQQGALAEGQIGLQTSINITGYAAQQAADLGLASAAKAAASNAETGGIFGFLGGAAKAIPLLGSLF